jgi:raffinose/stachyose/melibiose transport system permease protein
MGRSIIFKIKSARDFTVFTTPALIMISITSLIPFIMNFVYSFTNWDGLQKTVNFIGLDNFKAIIKDEEFLRGPVLFTFKYAFFYIILANVFSLFFALILVRGFKTKNLLRSMLYIPNIMSLVIVGYMWKFIFGVGFDALYEKTHNFLFQLSWLGDENLAFWSLLLVSLWQVVGFYTVIYIAGIQSIPHDVIEASMIDGATGLLKFFRVTLPLIMPSATVCVFTSILNALKVFDLPFVLTSGGPGGSTVSISYDIYNEAFINSNYGYGTAKSVLFFIVILLVTIIQVKFFKNKEVQV